MVEDLAGHPPKLVIMELSVLVRNRTVPTRSGVGLSASIRQVRSAVRAFVAAAPRLPSRQDIGEAWLRADVDLFESARWTAVSVGPVRVGQGWQEEFHEPTDRGWAALSALAKSGCAVIVLDVPRHPGSPVPPEFRGRLDRTIARLRDAGLRVLTIPTVPAEGFADEVHLNRAGAQPVRRRLAEALRPMIEGRR
jgi:hypothetical protein